MSSLSPSFLALRFCSSQQLDALFKRYFVPFFDAILGSTLVPGLSRLLDGLAGLSSSANVNQTSVAAGSGMPSSATAVPLQPLKSHDALLTPVSHAVSAWRMLAVAEADTSSRATGSSADVELARKQLEDVRLLSADNTTFPPAAVLQAYFASDLLCSIARLAAQLCHLLQEARLFFIQGPGARLRSPLLQASASLDRSLPALSAAAASMSSQGSPSAPSLLSSAASAHRACSYAPTASAALELYPLRPMISALTHLILFLSRVTVRNVCLHDGSSVLSPHLFTRVPLVCLLTVFSSAVAWRRSQIPSSTRSAADSASASRRRVSPRRPAGTAHLPSAGGRERRRQ
jgi:hypothetical protein